VAPQLRIEPLGEAALLAVIDARLNLDANARARALAAALGATNLDGLGVPVPGHGSVLVPFDPDVLAEPRVRSLIERAWPIAARATAADDAPGRLHELPTRYGGEDGPDLGVVARATGLSEAEVIRQHSGAEYRVLVLGFVPGYAYLGLLPPALELPRRETPRVRVPAGSVGISGRQCGVYPAEVPGGWHLIGRTDVLLWDPAADPPARLAPGDRVRFVPA
jgi:KipI family sensor histidine kinase inhibitor